MERGGRAYIVGLTLAVNLGGVGRGTRAVVDVGDVCTVNLAVGLWAFNSNNKGDLQN